MNLEIPGTVFLLIPFLNIKKTYLRISKYLAQFFCLSPFSNIKKTYLRILTLFILIIILKETIYIKTIIQTILIKTIIQIDKHKANTTKTLFSNIKKSILTNLKIPDAVFFFLIPFFN